MSVPLRHKLKVLRNKIRKLDSAVVAYSGGVDSTFLLRICRDELGDRAVAVTVLSSKYPKSELSLARRIAKVVGVKHVTIEPGELVEVPKAAGCAGKAYSSLKGFATRMKIRNVLDGSHKDDHKEKGTSYVAARYAGIQSPLLESGLSKAEIRMLARELGLPNWDKPSSSHVKQSSAKCRKSAALKRYLKSVGISAIVSVDRKSIRISGSKKDVVRATKFIDLIQKKALSLGFSHVYVSLSS